MPAKKGLLAPVKNDKPRMGIMVFTVKKNEAVKIGDSFVAVSKGTGNSIRISILAPREVSVKRTKAPLPYEKPNEQALPVDRAGKP